MFTHFDQQFFEDLTFVEYFEKYGFDQKIYPTCQKFGKYNLGFIIYENKKLVKFIDFHMFCGCQLKVLNIMFT
jgi:hypothetical protein